MIRLLRPALIVLLVALFATPQPTMAQETPVNASDGPAVLVADKVWLEGNTRLIASGNVEALYDDVRIKATRITYDRSSDQLSIEGPIIITSGDDVMVLADAAEMDPAWHDGLLTGARMVLNQQVQLAAHQLARVNGRYSELYKATVTSCRVCNDGRPPLWQIRARRVIHDQIERQLYFENAQFRVMDVPIFYLPRLRLPDPTLARATGFLIPKVAGNSEIGTGIKIPYFIRMGDHRDLTVTPYLSSNTRTVELRYRQAFRTGRIEFEGALSSDNLTSRDYRGYLFAEGLFNLKRDYKLSFDVEMTSDKTYLVDYDFSDKDRLDSEIAITRVRRDEYIRSALVNYHTLRVGEDSSTMPSIIGDVTYERRFFPRAMGGELRFSAGLHSHFRYSQLGIDGPDLDPPSGPLVDGRDVTRIEAEAMWLRNWTVGPGLRAGVQMGVAIDQFYTGNDLIRPSHASQITPMAAFSLRWPWRKTTGRGATHVIEPMMQLAWSGGSNPNVANDESTRVEFDEGNLMSISRFPAADRRERGLAAAYGINWTRIGPKGMQSSLVLGQITRETGDSNFSSTSGLRGVTSDLLVAGQIKTQSGLSLTGRALLGTNFNPAKTEARASWQTSRYALGASYVWLGADAAEDRLATVSEWSVDGLYRFNRHWSGSANMRYDVVSNNAAEAGLGLQYRNECIEIDLAVSRRFTSSIILTPSTDFSFTIGLNGFSAKASDKTYTRKCRN